MYTPARWILCPGPENSHNSSLDDNDQKAVFWNAALYVYIYVMLLHELVLISKGSADQFQQDGWEHGKQSQRGQVWCDEVLLVFI